MTIVNRYNLSKFNNVTNNELKALAKSRGFYLKPITHYNKMKPCICGASYRHKTIILGGLTQYVCNKCGFAGRGGYGDQQARDGWNKAVDMYYIYKELEDGNK